VEQKEAKLSPEVSCERGSGGGEGREAYCDGEDVALSAEGHEDGAWPAAAAGAACHGRLANLGVSCVASPAG